MKVATLNDVADWGSGGTPKRSIREYFGSEVPWLSIADLNDGVVNEAKESLSKAGLANSSAKLVPAGTLFIAMYGSIGKLGIAGRAMATSQAIAFAKPRTDVVDRRYLFHYLLSQRAKFQSRGRGGTQMNIGQSDLKAWPIPLPELSEQRRIAHILDKADALRTKRREAIAHLDALGQSIFHEMFGDSQDWPVSKLELLAMPEKGSVRTGPFGSQLLTSEFTSNGVAVLGIDNTAGNKFSWKERRFISEEKYEQLKRYTVHPGDLIITIMGTLGRCAVVPDDIPLSINTKHLCCITLDKQQAVPEYVHAYFLYHQIAARYLRQTTKGSIMAGLNMGIIKAMPVLVPPLDLQHEFANRVAAVERLKVKHQAQLAELDDLFLSLQDRAFKGEI